MLLQHRSLIQIQCHLNQKFNSSLIRALLLLLIIVFSFQLKKRFFSNKNLKKTETKAFFALSAL
jgi:hypothetical protein